ncbi:hypothetical protein M7I_0641 [Glarea lozoyensis 74030]|uniref:Uncharacterized protein n=1 Tax=Glarea lozoyensis (strain ATCC 74030 / MF5533) TaxID=1104152 RepID=H0EDJ2_GLAL7|nr:hypothetical protein M7I_0641 [Glarea lozoyensis 74030]
MITTHNLRTEKAGIKSTQIKRAPIPLLLLRQTSSFPVKQSQLDLEIELPTDEAVDSRPPIFILIERWPVKREDAEPVETQRESSGQAVMAGVGDVDGEGESLRNEGCEWRTGSGVVAMIAVKKTRGFEDPDKKKKNLFRKEGLHQ